MKNMNQNAGFLRVLDTAAACRSYYDFCRDYPRDYHIAKYRGWLPGVLVHCGWVKHGSAAAYDDPDNHTLSLKDVTDQTGYFYPDVLGDSLWPMEIE